MPIKLNQPLVLTIWRATADDDEHYVYAIPL